MLLKPYHRDSHFLLSGHCDYGGCNAHSQSCRVPYFTASIACQDVTPELAPKVNGNIF
jgi:hypothetical protein